MISNSVSAEWKDELTLRVYCLDIESDNPTLIRLKRFSNVKIKLHELVQET